MPGAVALPGPRPTAGRAREGSADHALTIDAPSGGGRPGPGAGGRRVSGHAREVTMRGTIKVLVVAGAMLAAAVGAAGTADAAIITSQASLVGGQLTIGGA